MTKKSSSNSNSNSNNNKPVVPGQEICIFMDQSYDESMSSLESFMSFMDDSEEDHRREKFAKKRSKPRRTLHQRTATPNSPPTRTNSNPEFGVRPPSSRWDMGRTNSCQSSPGKPRSSRRLSPTKSRPIITVARSKDDHMDSDAQSVTSLELKMLGSPGDRWSADASSSHHHSTSAHTGSLHNSMGTTSFGGNSSGRWQDSYAGGESGHESSCLSRWSASLSSSQMEQVSTRPRFPRRMRSGLKARQVASNQTAPSTETWDNSFAMTATTSPSTTGDFTDSHSTNRATTGSDIDSEFSTELDEGSSHHNKVIVDCSLLFRPQEGSTAAPAQAPAAPSSGLPSLKSMALPTPALPAVKCATKPRPQLPHRQKSFGRGMSIGMAAKAVLERRERFVKQRSEPSIVSVPPDRTPSDLSLSFSSHYSTEQSLQGSGVQNVRRNSFRRQHSMPQSIQCGQEKPATKENPAQTSPLAALRKQKSLSSLGAEDIPQLPERQSSQSSSATLHSNSTGAGRMFCKQKSLSSLPVGVYQGRKRAAQRSDSPQLPQRLPSESSCRALSCAGGEQEEQPNPTSLKHPPPMPHRQASMSSMAASVATATEQQRATNIRVVADLHDEKGLGNRRVSLTKQMSEPSALSLKKLVMFDDLKGEDWGSERPNKRQALLDLAANSTLRDDDGELTCAAVLTACRDLFPASSSNWKHRSLPELSFLSS